MSIFLIYFEIGKPVPPPVVSAPLAQFSVDVVFEGRTKPPNYSVAITDGVSSERFLRYGNKVADRLGGDLRLAFLAFVRKRLALEAHPAFIFHLFNERVDRIRVIWPKREAVSINELEQQLTQVQVGDLIEILP